MGEARRRAAHPGPWRLRPPRWLTRQRPLLGRRARDLAALLAMNLTPVLLAMVFHWEAAELMLAYSIETLVILIFHAGKMVTAGYAHRPPGLVSAMFCVPFFLIFFGIFCGGQSFFVLAFGAMVRAHWEFPIPLSNTMALIEEPTSLLVSVAGMLLYHGVEFQFGWLKHGGAKLTTPAQLMFQPPRRIAVIPITLIFAMPLVLVLREPLWSILLLGFGKCVLDVIGPGRAAPAPAPRSSSRRGP